MASILPEDNSLPVVYEGDFVNIKFSYDIDIDETINYIKITSTTLPDYIEIDGAYISGVFDNLFDLPKNSLKYRKGLEYGQVSNFNDLPEKGTASLYSYTPPSVMTTDFIINVELSYFDVNNNVLNITKVYTQTVKGTWETFRNKFIAYVR